jgi:myo-inositol-1(or 4)-monophosphatase
MDQRLKVGIEAIISAGDYLREQFLKEHQVSIKKDKTVLLGEDLKSEETLLSTISKAFPTDSFLTEERDTTIRPDSIWVFDPLCGSYSYLRGVETWSISAAFIADNKYQLGIVYQPYSKNLFYSELRKGAYMNKKKIRTSPITEVSEAFISIEHGVFNSKKYSLTQLIADMKRLRVGHGSGGELSYVAAGFLDAVIKTDQALMHFAGGRAIVQEAGGVFVDFSGNPAPTYFDKEKTINYIACANEKLAGEIRSYLH